MVTFVTYTFSVENEGTFATNDWKHWNVDKLQSYLQQNFMHVKPMPNDKNVLSQVVNQLILLKEKLLYVHNSMPKHDSSSQCKINAIYRLGRLYGDTSFEPDSDYSDDEMETNTNIEIVGDAHSLLPNNLDLLKLPDWSDNTPIAQLFQSSHKLIGDNNIINAPQKNGKKAQGDFFLQRFSFKFGQSKTQQATKNKKDQNPLDNSQNVFCYIALAIDKYGVNNMTSMPACCVTDDQDTRALSIFICFVKRLKMNMESESINAELSKQNTDNDNQIPIVCVKYYETIRSRHTGEKNRRISHESQHNRRIFNSLYSFQLSLDEIAMMGKLLKQNRKKLNQNVLKEIEKEYVSQYNIGMFKCSVFLPFCDKDKNVTKCANCGRNAVSRCSRCRKVSYCSQNCQRNHWKSSHKEECVI